MTMNPIERVTTHFTAKEIRIIEVPEWADEDNKPLEIYVKPMTMNEKMKLYNKARSSNPLESLIDTIIMKALDKQGNPLFTIKDKQALLVKADTTIIIKVANKILGNRSDGMPLLTLETAEKN